MMPRNRLLFLGILIALVLAAVNSGCGGSSGSGGGGQTAPLAVSLASGPLTVQAKATAQFTATVSGGGTNLQVDWKASCSAAACGTFSPTTTSSGAATTYAAPASVPSGALAVTITATSVADSTKSASTSTTAIVGISEAHGDAVKGTPRLIVNGNPTAPLLFMDQEYLTDRLQYLAPQVKDAAAADVHLFSIHLQQYWPWDNQGTATLDFSAVDQLLDRVIKADPQAGLILKVGIWPGPGWVPPVPPTNADYILYFNGQVIDPFHFSLASDIVFNGFLTSVPHLLQHFESSWYAAHILGYLICAGTTDEWFPADFQRGPDYSPVNTAGFQAWLQTKYGTDAALSAAWGMPVTIATAQVPPVQPGRFPWPAPPPTGTVNAFYQLPTEQDWVDYSAYTSDLTSQRMLAAAQLVRTQTGGKRLIGFYYGYMFDLAGGFNGHMRGDLLMASSNVDFLCAPNSYITIQERNAGGAGGMMPAMDSVAAHGKLWFNENDLNTYLSAESGLPQFATANGNMPTADLTETVDVLQRDMAALLVHRVGTWWMDLNEDGAFNDPNIWTVMSDYGVPLFGQLYANPQPYHSDVALIVDRTSIFYQRDDGGPMVARSLLRNAVAKSGVAWGVYYLDDFISGTAPTNRVYIFANAAYLNTVQISQIQSRLNAEAATAIWVYAPGFLGANGGNVSQVSLLTGIQLSQSDGYTYTDGDGPMAGYSWGFSSNNPLSPRLIVTDTSAEILGHYRYDGLSSAAMKQVGNFQSIFTGEYAPLSNNGNWTPDATRALLQLTGVHIWTTAGDVIHTDGNLFVIHAAAAGPDTISLPAGVSATPLGGGSASTGTLTLTFSRVGETQWFQLSQSSQGATSPAHRRSELSGSKPPSDLRM